METETPETLLNKHYRFAHWVASRFKRWSGVEYEELYAESLYGMYRAALQYDPENDFGASFTTYAHRACWGAMKRYQRQHRHYLDNVAHVEVELEDPNPPPPSWHLRDECTKVLAKIPNPERGWFVRHYVEGEGLKEIAEEAGLSKQAVHQRLQKQRRKILRTTRNPL